VSFRITRASLIELDAAALRRVDSQAIRVRFRPAKAIQLLGWKGARRWLNRLGAVMESRPDLFAILTAAARRPVRCTPFRVH